MKTNSNKHPIFFARQHYQRLKNDRRALDLRYEIYRAPAIGYRLLGFTRPNQHTRRRLLEHFGTFNPESWLDARDRCAWLHGRVCIPHPACPEAFELACWISYHDASAITGRSAHSFARWRWDESTEPDEPAWRLLESHCHGVCAWPPRPPRTAANDNRLQVDTSFSGIASA